MKNSIFASFILLALCFACSNERESASGQKFTMLSTGDGKEIPVKRVMIMDFIFKDSKDSVWYDTRKNPYPQIMEKQKSPVSGDKLMEVIYMLSKGDSVTLKMSAADVFTKSFRQAVPPKVDSASLFTFVVKMRDALDSAQFIKYRNEMVAKLNEEMRVKQDAQFKKDSIIIDNYLKEKNITTLSTASGIRYVVTKKGAGENAKQGQTVKVNYAGYLLNGKCFDTCIEAVAKKEKMDKPGGKFGPIEFPVGRGAVIKGWDEILQQMNKGCKMTVYIPSTLAYGSGKRGQDIVENSILSFDMELVDIK